MHTLTEIKLANSDDMVFDAQTALLNSGICEKGLDDIECNAMLVCIFEKNGQQDAQLLFNWLALRKEIYNGIQQLSSFGVAKDMLAYNDNIIQHANGLCNATAQEDDKWIWTTIMNKDVKHDASKDDDWPVKVDFCLHNFLGFYADDGIYYNCDGRLVVMKRRGCNRTLVIRFE